MTDVDALSRGEAHQITGRSRFIAGLRSMSTVSRWKPQRDSAPCHIPRDGQIPSVLIVTVVLRVSDRQQMTKSAACGALLNVSLTIGEKFTFKNTHPVCYCTPVPPYRNLTNEQIWAV